MAGNTVTVTQFSYLTHILSCKQSWQWVIFIHNT